MDFALQNIKFEAEQSTTVIDETFSNQDESNFEDFIDEIDDDEDYKEPRQNEQSRFQKNQSVEYICSICSLDFPSLAYLKRHYNTKKHIRALAMAQRGRKINQKKKYVRKNITLAVLNARKEKYFNDANNYESKEVQNNFEKNQAETNQDNVNIQSALEQNQRIQPKPSSNYCKPCNKFFNFRFHYAQHVKCVHSENRYFKCQTCDQRLETKDLLEIHMIKHIKDINDLKCKICGKGFVRLDDLEMHYMFHIKMIRIGK